MCLFIDVTHNTFMAAGKNTIYITIDGKTVKQRQFDSDITGTYLMLGTLLAKLLISRELGVSHTNFGYVIATRKKYYRGPGTLKLDEVEKLEEDPSLETPNMSVSPDGR